MIKDGNHSHNTQNGVGDSQSLLPNTGINAEPEDLPVTPRVGKFHRRSCISDRARSLRIALLGCRVGYLEIEPFSHRHTLDELPKRSFGPNEIIPCSNVMCVIERGWVQITHTRYHHHVKTLETGGVFGEMPLLGQTMLMTQATAGALGVTVTVIDRDAASRWIVANPVSMFEIVVPRLAEMASDRFRAQYQPGEARLAALLLHLASGHSVIEGYTQRELAETLGLYRETVTVSMRRLKSLKIISAGRRRIRILDAARLRQLSEI